MTCLPILEHQLGTILDKQVVEEIAITAERSNLLILGQEPPCKFAFNQRNGECLVIVVADCEEPISASFTIKVPLEVESAREMLDPSISSSDFLEAIANQDLETVSSFFVSYMHGRGISLERQVARHQQMIDMEVADAMLVVLRSGPDRFFLHEIFLGDRTDLGMLS